RRWGCGLVFAVGCFALLGGCKNEEDGCDGSDCGEMPSYWVMYDAWPLGNSAQDVAMNVEIDGKYLMRLTREGSPTEELECGDNCEEGSSNSLCMTGWLDNDQVTTMQALQQDDLSQAYVLDHLASEPVNRFVTFRPNEDGAEGFNLRLNSEGALQPETAALIDTLDGIALDLYARAEYCNEEYRALAEDGEWVFPISE
ncbi:MAG TPA: hypothetical protein PLU22_23610, partial [Polyangiaceae bacterium]|nr:hypothetical protein [Polyangiaceae bacterium]